MKRFALISCLLLLVGALAIFLDEWSWVVRDRHGIRCADLEGASSSQDGFTPRQRRRLLSRNERLPWSGDGAVPRPTQSQFGLSRNGNALDNVLAGSADDDVFFGDQGNDRLIGEAGNDMYVFDIDHGEDTIEDSDGLNVIEVLAAVDLDGITALVQGKDLVINYSSQGTIRIERYAKTDRWLLMSSCGGDALPVAALFGRS